jgi:transcriptional regulator with XRE-family HTH domain
MMNDNQLSIGRNIRAIRLKLSLTQQQLADQCSLTKGMISKVENGVVVPAVATLTKIAQAMHVKVSDLIEAKDQTPSLLTINPFSDKEKFITTNMGYCIYNPAVGLADKVSQPILITAREGEVKPHIVSHPGEEYIFIFEGEMNFRVNGTQLPSAQRRQPVFRRAAAHGIYSVNGFVNYLDMFVGHHFEASPVGE